MLCDPGLIEREPGIYSVSAAHSTPVSPAHQSDEIGALIAVDRNKWTTTIALTGVVAVPPQTGAHLPWPNRDSPIGICAFAQFVIGLYEGHLSQLTATCSELSPVRSCKFLWRRATCLSAKPRCAEGEAPCSGPFGKLCAKAHGTAPGTGELN